MSDEGSSYEVPRLEGWLTFPEAGEVLGISKQMVHKLAFPASGKSAFSTVRAVGDRPMYLVKEEEVEEYKNRPKQQPKQQPEE